MELGELSRLDQELTAARLNYRKAQADVTRMEVRIRAWPPGHRALTTGSAQANQTLKQAAEQYRAALKAYSEYGKKRSDLG